MSGTLYQPCANLAKAGFDAQQASEETWDALRSANIFVEGDFTLASGKPATLKADAEILYYRPRQLPIILGHFASFPCVQAADVLLYVPNGMRKFMHLIGEKLNIPVVDAIRKPDSTSKYEFEFATPEDKEMALAAELPVIGEDVVSTLGSVAGMRTLLRPEQDVHSLAILLRGTVNPDYQTGLRDHYLVEREIPTDSEEFRRQYARPPLPA